MRVVDAIAQWFEVAGFKHYFGYAGGAVWPFLDALTDKPEIEGIQAKHESHAVHMADLYHRVGGRIAPVIVSKGPGLLNAVGACASAMHESSPVLIIAGGSTTHFLGKAGMQEIYYHGFEDATSIFRPVCKGTWMVVRPDTIIDVLNYALKAATSGRPGPVFVEVPYDIQLAPVEGEIEAPSARAPQLNRPRADAANVERIARMIAEAERPLLLAGGGVVRSRAADALKVAAETLNIPTATTLPAKGMLPEDHPLSIGTLGRSGFVCAARASREADLVIGVGARFSDNHTANWRKGSIYDVTQTKIVQVDLDYQEAAIFRSSSAWSATPSFFSRTWPPRSAAQATRSIRAGSSAPRASAPSGRRRSGRCRRPIAHPRIRPASSMRSVAHCPRTAGSASTSATSPNTPRPI
jgi:acetolactate synthase I/II/III large subunit